jgi:hypothetical protein
MRSKKGAKVRSTRDSCGPRKKGPPEGAAPSSLSTVSIVRMKPSRLASWPLQVQGGCSTAGRGQCVEGRSTVAAGGPLQGTKGKAEGS